MRKPAVKPHHNRITAARAIDGGLPLRRRRGMVLVMFAIILPILVGMVGLVVDSSLLMAKHRNLQHFADLAATAAAAMDMLRGESNTTVIATANWHLSRNHISNADVTVNVPPLGGTYAGNSKYVEVIVSRPVQSYFIQVLGAAPVSTVRVQSVAGYEETTTGAAVVVLESEPPSYTIAAGSPLYSTLPASSAGLEILGTTKVKVDGAVLVNTEWGVVDENGVVVGNGPGPPYGIKCSIDALSARDIRVAGGVDDLSKYQSYVSGAVSPLQANRFPVPDPLKSLPVPTTSTDSSHVNTKYYGGKSVSSEDELKPGIYDWIDVDISSDDDDDDDVEFEHGIYIIRSVNPATGLALYIRGNQVTLKGVMFYITDSPGYSATTGLPDALDGERSPVPIVTTTLLPSVVIDIGADCQFSPLNSPNSPFDGMLIYQRRLDRRPIIIHKPVASSSSSFSGCVYSKWGHVIFADVDTSDTHFVAGSMRIINLSSCKISPSVLFPPAEDVFLVQ